MRSTPIRLIVILLPLVVGLACTGWYVMSWPTTPAAEPAPAAHSTSWPMFGGTNQRNMVNLVEKDVLTSWSVEDGKEQNLKWIARVGSFCYGGPVIADGKIFVGTNNSRPRDPRLVDAKKKPLDKGILMCFRESDGAFLWQAVHDKLEDDEKDGAQVGICSHPVVEGKRLYYVSNRCELVCADTEGTPGTKEAKFIWKLDMIGKLGVFPSQAAATSPLIVGDLVYVVTGNGVDAAGKLVAPKAPSFVAVDKNTGNVKWQSNLPGDGILDGQWGYPTAAEIDGVTQVVFPGGDGWLYAFEAKKGDLLWKFDCNPKASKFDREGRGDRNYLVATPAIHDKKVYIGVGQNPDHGGGVGHLWCIDMTKKPTNKDKDLSPVNDNFDPKAAVNKDSGLVWHYGGKILPEPKSGREFIFARTIGTVAVHDGLVYAADLEGIVHCLDAQTGKLYWDYDLKGATWCSPFYVDGKVFVGNNAGEMHIFAAGKEKKLLNKIDMEQALNMPPVIVNGVLYINTGTKIIAVAKPKS
jgi:outer membrane protein assembly factor BamB